LIYALLFVGLLTLVQSEAGENAASYLIPIGSGFQNPVVSTVYGTLLPVWLVFGYAIYRAREYRWWVSGIRLGDVRFDSKLTAGALIGLYWKVIGWSFLILIVLIAWIGGLGAGLYLAIGGKVAAPEATAVAFQDPLFLTAVVLGYIACALAFGVVVRMYLRRDVWARVVASTVVYNLAAADNVAARGEAANALGEGFADSLDIGGF